MGFAWFGTSPTRLSFLTCECLMVIFNPTGSLVQNLLPATSLLHGDFFLRFNLIIWIAYPGSFMIVSNTMILHAHGCCIFMCYHICSIVTRLRSCHSLRLVVDRREKICLCYLVTFTFLPLLLDVLCLYSNAEVLHAAPQKITGVFTSLLDISLP